MNRSSILAVSALLLLASGCATKSFVREQTDPMAARLSALELKMSGIESRLDRMDASDTADKALLQKTMDTANQAQAAAKNAENIARNAENLAVNAEKTAENAEKAVKNVENAALRAEEMAKKAEAGSKEAEAAARQAEKAVQKKAKIFELDQKK